MIKFDVVDLTTFETAFNGHKIIIQRNDVTRQWEIFLDGKPTHIRYDTAGECKHHVTRIVNKLERNN